MITIYLRFADRAEALGVLAATLGYGPAGEAGAQWWPTTGTSAGTRYDLDFLADQGVIASSGEDLVNLLWWGPAEDVPDFGGHVVSPATPSCTFAL